ncbi:MAG: hypothetical protein FWC61_02610 [Proteobacteria bacterium]|nr:hypothetical protein [Pseudomonadota bacterium]
MNNVNKFIQLANFYNQMLAVMAAICVQKGGIPIEQYVGRFFAADVLEFLAEYGAKLQTDDESVQRVAALFRAEYEKAKDLTTPSQKPIFEMTLEEFEKVMNI